MAVSPIIERELRLALRKKHLLKSRMKYAAIGVGMAALCLLINAFRGSGSYALTLHGWLFYLGLIIAVFGTMQLTADLFTQERQNHGFGFLFLSGVKMREFFGAKVLGALLVSSTNLLALAPCLAIPFLTGGVSFSLFLATLCCLPTLMLFTLAVSCLASALWGEESTARVGAMVISGVLGGVPLLLYEVSRWSSHSISPVWRLFSPAWGPLMVDSRFSIGSLSEFWGSTVTTLLWSIAFFLLAIHFLRRAWDQQISGAVAQTWSGRFCDWMQGGAGRGRKQRRWLDINPFIWLAVRNRHPARLAWAVVCMIVMGSVLCGLLMPKAWLKVWMFFAVGFLTNGTVEWIAAYTAAKRLGDDRRSNALELLLTTPVEVNKLIRGQVMALELQFRRVFQVIFVLNLSMMIAGFFIRTWTWRSLCVYCVVWASLLIWSWHRTFNNSIRSMWAGLNTGLPAFAAWRSWGFQRYWYVNVYFTSSFMLKGGEFPTGSWLEFWFVMVFAVFAGGYMIYMIIYPEEHPEMKIRDMLLSEFRLIAAEPMPDPNDPRLKNWKVDEPLYRHKFDYIGLLKP